MSFVHIEVELYINDDSLVSRRSFVVLIIGTLNSCFILMISGRLTIDPSMEYKPSTMTRIFFQGRCVLGCPCEMTSVKSCRKSIMLLCLNTRIEAPDKRAPKTMELWFSSSLIIKQPCVSKKYQSSVPHTFFLTLPTREGMVVELVANPIETQIASSLPTNSATFRSM